MKILELILHPIKAYQEWQYKRYKKEFLTKTGIVKNSNKYHRQAKRVK